jgi:hypothetical protein
VERTRRRAAVQKTRRRAAVGIGEDTGVRGIRDERIVDGEDEFHRALVAVDFVHDMREVSGDHCGWMGAVWVTRFVKKEEVQCH